MKNPKPLFHIRKDGFMVPASFSTLEEAKAYVDARPLEYPTGRIVMLLEVHNGIVVEKYPYKPRKAA